jgi:tripartite-type tricarboxylate transporter receptor subunit TctC
LQVPLPNGLVFDGMLERIETMTQAMKAGPTRRRLLQAGAALASTALLAPAVRAQAAPLRLVVGFPAGGTADALARALAPVLGGADTAAVVENRAGATGQLAADHVRGVADGSALLVTPSSVLSLAPLVTRKPLFDSLADFAPIGGIGDHAMGFAVPASSPHESLPDYLRWAKAHPKDASYATPGIGSALHFLGALLARETGVALLHVPYRGVMPGVQDLIGGQVSATVNPLPTLIEFHKAGRIRLLAVTSPQRVASLPQVPTVAELKLQALELVEWYGVFASARVAPAVLESLQQRLAQAAARPAFVEAARRLEVTPLPTDAPELRRLLQSDIERWRAAVKATGIRLED